MAKPKSESLPNRHQYTRVSYLHQAASYLATLPAQSTTSASESTSSEPPHDGDAHQSPGRATRSASETVARRCVTEIRAVSLKSQVRPSPAVKQMLCKYCDSLLVEGKTCSTTVQNASKGGRKPWADVMVTRCKTCGHVKRFPVSAPRQKRRPFREPQVTEEEAPAADLAEEVTGGE